MKKTDLNHFRDTLIAPLPVPPGKHVLENLFHYDLKVTPEEIWPYLSDTSRMNKELGFPPRVEKEVHGENHVFTKTLGRQEEWIEKPWIWVFEKELQNHRVFKKGWMTEQRGVFTVEETNEGCRVNIYFRWTFSNILTKLLFSSVGSVLDKKFVEFFRQKEQLITDSRKSLPIAEIPAEPLSPYDTLMNYLRNADELDLDRLHLKKLSKELSLPLDLLLDVCQIMVKEGYLSLSWDVVCPHCRGVRAENSGLAFIKMENTCEACDVDFQPEMEESIEVVFHVTDKLRKIQKIVYCAAEPFKKKHIKLNQIISAGNSQSFDLKLKPGIYRFRVKNSKQLSYLEVNDSHDSKEVSLSENQSVRKSVNTSFKLNYINSTQKDVVITLEEAWWFSDRLLPREVLTNPVMRTILSEDHLEIGVKLNIGNQVIMFTDIVGSTPFYKELGDAKAMKAVQDHYNEVKEIILSHRGVIVKYIGDAIMAAFLSIEDAYICSVDIHKKFHKLRNDTPIKLRVSFHEGPVLCANMNVGIDYFGNTVNQAAKIQKWAGAFEIAITEKEWEEVQTKASSLESRSVRDEKLELDVRIISVEK